MTAVKVAIDQFFQAPALLALMITGMALMDGKGIAGVYKDMQKDYKTALIKNCKWFDDFLWTCKSRLWKVPYQGYLAFSTTKHIGELWIPATIINIAFVKPDLRVLYDNLVFFFWTIFLSMLLNETT